LDIVGYVRIISPWTSQQEFPFELSSVEEKLLAGGGVIDLYRTYGNAMFRKVF
jgi:hypothetical protein